MPQRGSRRARLHSARLIDSYGTRYWEVTYSHDEAPDEVRKTFLDVASVYDDPRPGDNIIVTYSTNKVTSIHHTD